MNTKIIDLNLIESLLASGRLGSWVRSINTKLPSKNKKPNSALDFTLDTLTLDKKMSKYDNTFKFCNYIPAYSTSTATSTVNYYVSGYTSNNIPAVNYTS